MLSRKNLIVVGISLLLVFGVAIGLIGRRIGATVNEMRNSMFLESAGYRAELIASDFRKTVGLAHSVQDYITQNVFHEKELQDLLRGLVRMDAKVTRIWYRYRKGRFICVDSVGAVEAGGEQEPQLEAFVKAWEGKRKNSLYCSDGVLYWCLCVRYGELTLGVDMSLPDLHAYFADMNLGVRSYAYVVNEEGRVIVHPDEHEIGRHLTDSSDIEVVRKLVRHDGMIQKSGFSRFLLLPVKQACYPISVGKEKWVVVINVPELVMEEEMNDFHRYTLLIALVAVLVFSVLLAYSQHKWRIEYDRRRKLEQETLQLNLLQLKNQINPHFLFNALNSLSALIGKEQVLAKEFVLKLSKIYRYVLEKRNESFVPVREEVEFIRYYGFLQKIRFPGQLNVDIEAGLKGEERKIPFMSLQILMENAVKHNEITRRHPLVVHIYEKGGAIIVENSYCPRSDESSDSLGIGFENIRKIYAYCSEKRFTYFIEGERFVCVLPLV